MRRLLRFVLALLVLGAVFVAVTRPEQLPFRVPWTGQTPAPPQVEAEADAPAEPPPNDARRDDTPPDNAVQTGPFGEVTDAAITALVARQSISIPALRAREYPGSDLSVVRDLKPGSNYSRQVVSYQSDGLKIFGLLTVPNGAPPEGGWPAIVFNHGYIPPQQYRTTERYVAYQDAFARAGYVTLKSDYRGHGDSEGEARGGYNDPGYTVDVLNAAASLKRDPRVNRARMGVWGHSMGGQLSLRAMLVDPELKAASLWAGVVASYDVLATDWHPPGGEPGPTLAPLSRRYLRALSPNAYLQELDGRPIELQQGTADEDVPYSFQRAFADDLRAARQRFTAYRYPGDNHNLSGNLRTALDRSVAFFDDHL